MPKTQQTKILERTAAFLRNEPPSLFASLCLSPSPYAEAAKIAGEIKRLTMSQSPLERILFLGLVSELVAATKKTGIDTEPLKTLKQALSIGSSAQWKEAFLQLQLNFIYPKQQRLKPFKKDVTVPIEFNTARFVDQAGALAGDAHHRVVGTTFVTNKTSILNRSSATPPSEEKILDALCVAQLNEASEAPSVVMAIGDGCGGHFGDDHQDRQIWRATHFATKNAVRFMAAYPDAESLKLQLPQVIQAIAHEVRCKLGSGQEGSTLAAVRTFPMPNSAQCRVVGFSIGDSIVAHWDPQTEQCTTLLSARQWVSGLSGQTATAIFPFCYRDEEIQWIDTIVPTQSILLCATDGGYEGLPCIVRHGQGPTGDRFQTIQLDSEAIKGLFAEQKLSAASSVKDYVDCLIHTVIEHAEAKREEQAAEAEIAQRQLDVLMHEESAARASPRLWKKHRQQLDTLYGQTQIQQGDDVMLGGMRI